MISPRRRQVIIAGLGTLAAPAIAHAVRPYTPRGLDPSHKRLVLSGRVLGPDGKPLGGAMVAVGEDRTATDADGRFVLTTTTGQPYCVTRDGRAAEGFVANQRRDTNGTWRATFGLTLA